jgi:hypothetical protein
MVHFTFAGCLFRAVFSRNAGCLLRARIGRGKFDADPSEEIVHGNRATMNRAAGNLVRGSARRPLACSRPRAGAGGRALKCFALRDCGCVSRAMCVHVVAGPHHTSV